MKVNLENHPCFNEKARHESARVHLPVAPRCNVQCNFCLRDFDCVNESRPGVTSAILSPVQALAYLKDTVTRIPNVSVVGIAGPGDPFANTVETLDTLSLVRQAFPEMILCVATNGLNLLPYVDALAALDVSHVTITINGVVPEIVEKVYAWLKYEKRTQRGIAAAAHLIDCQLKAITALKSKGVLVKVNSILIPGVNEDHIREVARVTAEHGAEVFNVMPLIPNPGTPFGSLTEPTPELTRKVRAQAGLFIKQMGHCSRCRADAAGLIGQTSPETDQIIRSFENWEEPKTVPGKPERPNVAVASMEGALVNLHLGQAREFLIYEKADSGYRFKETRLAPPPGQGDERWNGLAALFADCHGAFVSGAGARPQEILGESGVEVFTVEGVISEVLESFSQGKDMSLLIKREVNACSSGCRGTGGLCG